MSLTLTWIDDTEFASLRDEWNRLLANSAADNFFLRWEWMHTWWSVYSEGRTLSILTENGRLIGIAPLFLETRTAWPKARILRFCSTDLAPDYLDFIIENGREAEVCEHFFRALANSRTWDLVVLSDTLHDAVVLKYFPRAVPLAKRFAPSIRCPAIRIEQSFDGYVKTQRETTGLSLRELRRKERKLFDEEKGVHVSVQRETELAQSIRDLFALHEVRSEQKGIHTNFVNDRALRFHERLAPLLLPQGMLVLDFLYHERKPISATYSFRYKNKLYHYQKGMDPQWSRLSVGMILHRLMIERAFNEGLVEVDLLKGEDRYKHAWTNAMREEVTVTVYNRTFSGRLWWALGRIKAVLRPLWRYRKRFIG